MLKNEEILVLEESKAIDDDRHILLAGITGSAKTAFMERICEMKWEQGKKVIFFTLKDEATCLGFPETDKSLVSLIEENGRQPTAFPTEVFVPFARSFFDSSKSKTMKITLPRHTKEFIEEEKRLHEQGCKYYGWSEWKPFKLAFQSLRAEDLVGLGGLSTDVGKTLLELVFKSKVRNISELLNKLVLLSKKREDLSGASLLISVEEASSKAAVGKPESYTALISLVSSIQDKGLICDKGNAFELDLNAVMQNKEVITIFNLSNLDSRFQFMVLSSLLRQILELRNKKRDFPRCVLAIPELAFLCGSKTSFNPFAYLTKPTVEFISKQGRLLGITLIADVQAPSDLEGSVMNNFGWFCLTTCNEKMVSFIHENVLKLDEPVRQNLAGLQTGTYAILPMGKHKPYQYPCFVCPSLGFHVKPSINVLDWVSKWNGIEMKEYVDELSYGIIAEVVLRSETLEGKRFLDLIVGKALKKQGKEYEKQIKVLERKLGKSKGNSRKEEIIELQKQGLKQSEIAKRLGITHQRVSQIIQASN